LGPFRSIRAARDCAFEEQAMQILRNFGGAARI
jgi:hypothetical protein